ncbi:MAG: hypothetical protein ONB05_00925, partial [candidate division KSB1 bacterium]|nr:hypothetical protein [candidate division KSB1 bacterium]
MAPIRQIIKLIALALFLFSNPVYSQGVSKTVRAQNSIYPFCFTKLGVTNIARGGASVAELGCPIAAFSNPAGLSSDKVIIYFEAGKRFAADWLYDLKWDNQFILPAYATIVKPMKRGSISIGYLNYYSLRRELEMEITTISQPEGTGEMLTATTEMNVHSLFCAGSYCLNPMSNVGLTIGLNYLRHQDKMYHRSIAKGQGFGFQLIVGGLLTPIEKLKLGAAFRYATGINYDMKMEGRVLLVQIDVDSSVWGNNPNINASFTTISFPFTAEFPWSLEIGMSYELSGDVNLLA